jgi:signal transduction histidine kinase
MIGTRSLRLPVGVGLAVVGLSALAVPGPVLALATAALVLAAQSWPRRGAGRAAKDAETRQRNLRNREEQVAHTAHELRTPLAAVTTALELLRDGYAASAEDWQSYVDQATVATRHMAFLINDVVDLAAIESGRLSLHVRPHRVQELFFDVARVMQLTAQGRGVDLRVEESGDELLVHADRGRYLQIAFNLIGNAVKFSAPGMAVRLCALPLEESVRFEIHDCGPGVSPDQRELLFTRFGRVHSATMPTIGGSGLGLHVCKLLVEHMGGRIGYRPGAEAGSVFWFTLPRPLAGTSTAAVAQLEQAPA